MTRKETIARLRLIRTPHIGPATYQHLLRESGDAFTALRRVLQGDLPSKRRFTPPSESVIEQELQQNERLGVKLLFHDQPEYPELLRQVPLAPIALCLLGNPDLLHAPSLALVGARNASHVGRRMAEKLAHELSGQGYVIVSGMARGIDAVAHQNSLDGGTIAVLAGGLDQIYPPENTELYHAIKEKGLIVSEMPLGTEPQARLFPRRNRIIAGLCRLTMVIESSLKSGSGITANFAADYGREVAAVPGSPLDSRNLGTLRLIRDGAHVITSSEDVIDILTGLEQRTMREPDVPFVAEEYDKSTLPQVKQWIIDYLGAGSCPIAEMIIDIPANKHALLAALAELEMDGILLRQWDNRAQLSQEQLD